MKPSCCCPVGDRYECVRIRLEPDRCDPDDECSCVCHDQPDEAELWDDDSSTPDPSGAPQ